MAGNKLVETFEDTLQLIESNEKLKQETLVAVTHSKVYAEEEINGNFYTSRVGAEVIVEENTTFASARKYKAYGKVAVLNFANPHTPGGGVEIGAMAQEECLCRSSNLFSCLISKEAGECFYNYNINQKNYFFSNRIIYSPGVTVFKTDDRIPQLLQEKEWFQVDVITCAAPYAVKLEDADKEKLQNVFEDRIGRIFDVARDNAVKVLILGAFGCGAFGNSPEIVAKAFHKVVDANKESFDKIIFAIKSSVKEESGEECPNVKAFEREFGVLSKLGEKKVEIIDFDPEATSQFYSIEDGIKLFNENTGKNIKITGKDFITIGKNADCILRFEHPGVSRSHANIFFKDEKWLLEDCNSTNGTWLNDVKLDVGKYYVLHLNDVIDFAHAEKITFFKYVPESKGTEEEKAIAILEAAMESFAQSGQKSEIALKLIIAGLKRAPLYVPVAIDMEAMFGNVKMEDLKPGFQFSPEKAVRMKIQTMSAGEVDFIPVFTSCEELNKGPSTSTMHSYPVDYLPKVMAMNKTVVINPFGGNHFIMSPEFIRDVLWPIISNTGDTKKQSPMPKPARGDLSGIVVGEKYRLEKIIGGGNAAKIYQVRELNTDRMLVAKVVDKTHSKIAQDSVNAEVKLLAKMNHPYIRKAVDLWQDDNYALMFMENVSGTDLEQMLKIHNAPFPPSAVVNWGKQIAEALAYMHSLIPPIVHRDIKPGNILLDENGKIKIIDLGIAVECYPGVEEEAEARGTMGYAAPEQHAGVIAPQIDIHALGMTMHYLVTGIRPIGVDYVYRPIRQINKKLPKKLEKIIDKCTMADPKMRYQSAAEVLRDLGKM